MNATPLISAAEIRQRPRKSVLGWPDVLRALSDASARSAVLDAYRSAGFSPDDFGRLRAAREVMAGALSRAEDGIELRRQSPQRDRERAAVRAVRRQLEVELWP